MRYPRVLVHESDGKLAWLLENLKPTAGFFLKNRPEAGQRQPADEVPYQWLLRQPRQLASCLRLLRGGGPAILIIRVAHKLATERNLEQRHRERAIHLLERIAWLRPETQLVAVSDAADDDLAALAWELGATYVLFPPQSLQTLPVVVGRLMETAPGLREASA